ncbi:MAG: CsbD family protein [Acidiphilium sp.]|jgi:Uncharacterized protein conserved in bacteria|nr:CsbD family protein [Acidiphilium sp.]
MDEDEIKGTAKDIGGKIKDGIGGLTGDESLQAEGKTDQLAGKAQKLYGSAKDAVSDAAESAKEAVGHAAGAASEAFSQPKSHYQPTGNSYVDESMLGRCTTMVKEQPILALLGTALAGYATAYLLHRRSRR